MVVTVMSTVPAVCAGDVAVTEVEELTVTLAAGCPGPKLTLVAPAMKPVPVIVTVAPPLTGPALVLSNATVGGSANVNLSAVLAAEVPPGVVTVTSIVPAAPAGTIAAIEVVEFTIMLLAGLAPNWTLVAPGRKLVPVIVIAVPPAVGPALALIAVTVGAGS